MHMRRRQRLLAKTDVTLGANKIGLRLPLVNLVIENPAIVRGRGHMTTFSTTTRSNRNHQGLAIGEIHVRYVVTLNAADIRMFPSFVPKGPRQSATGPRGRNSWVFHSHRLRQLLIKVCFHRRLWIHKLVASFAIWR